MAKKYIIKSGLLLLSAIFLTLVSSCSEDDSGRYEKSVILPSLENGIQTIETKKVHPILFIRLMRMVLSITKIIHSPGEILEIILK